MSVYRELFEKGLIDLSTSVRASNYGAMGKCLTSLPTTNSTQPWGTLNETFLNKYENANTDWFDVLFRTLAQQQYISASPSGK